jgi:DNA-binding PadR family transcriptional regulator
LEHSFNVDVATKVGVNAAVIFNNIGYWVNQNVANNKNFYDGNYWTYNSKKAYSELFPYMTERQVEYALNKLKDAGYIITGNYNKSPYDKTCWYALTEKGFDVYKISADRNKQKTETDRTKLLDQGTQIVEPIPVNKQTNNKPNEKDISKDISNVEISAEQFLITSAKQKEHKPNLYEKCLAMINDYTEDKDIRNELREYLEFILEKSRNENKQYYANQFKGLLKDLTKLEKDGNDVLEVIRQSLAKGYYSKFYPVNNKSYNSSENRASYRLPKQKIGKEEDLMRDKDGNYISF